MVPSSILKCKVQAAREDTGTYSFPSFTLSSKTACHASQRKQKKHVTQSLECAGKENRRAKEYNVFVYQGFILAGKGEKRSP